MRTILRPQGTEMRTIAFGGTYIIVHYSVLVKIG